MNAPAELQGLRCRLADVVEMSPGFMGLATPSGEMLHVNHHGRSMVGIGDEGLPDLLLSRFQP